MKIHTVMLNVHTDTGAIFQLPHGMFRDEAETKKAAQGLSDTVKRAMKARLGMPNAAGGVSDMQMTVQQLFAEMGIKGFSIGMTEADCDVPDLVVVPDKPGIILPFER